MRIPKFLTRNSSTILTFVGAAGTIATAVLTGRATIKATNFVYSNMRWETEDKHVHYAPKAEIVKAVWKEYIPAVGVGIGTIACIFGANALNKQQQATLMSAYAILERTYREYRKKVTDILGEESAEKVDNAIAEEKVKDHETPSDGHHLFYEPYYGQAVERTMLEVLDAEYRLNQKFAVEGEATLNDFYELLGMSKTDTGYLIGWTQEASWDNYNYQWIEFQHDLKIGEDGMEYYVINMPFPPTFGFSDPL